MRYVQPLEVHPHRPAGGRLLDDAHVRGDVPRAKPHRYSPAVQQVPRLHGSCDLIIGVT